MTEIEIWRHYVAIQGNASPGFSSGASRGCRVPSPPRPAPEVRLSNLLFQGHPEALRLKLSKLLLLSSRSQPGGELWLRCREKL